MRLASSFVQGVCIRLSSCSARSLSYVGGPEYVRHAHYRAGTFRGSARPSTAPGTSIGRSSDVHKKFFPPSSPEGRKLQADIAAGTVKAAAHFQNSVDKGEVSLGLIRDCLIAEKQRIFSLPRKSRPKALETTNPLARNVLLYIWAHNELWIPLISYGGTLVTALCYFAIAEDLEQLLLSWLEVPEPKERLLHEIELIPNMWRGQLLMGIVAAHMWHNTSRSADSALKTFFWSINRKTLLAGHLTEEIPVEEAPPIAFLSFAYAAAIIRQELITGSYWGTDPRLYENFQGFIKSRKRVNVDARLREFHLAYLAMHHPTSPTSDLALQFMRQQVSSADTAVGPLWDSFADPVKMKAFFQRAQRLLLREDRSADAEEMAKEEARMLAQPSRRPPRRAPNWEKQ